MSMVTSKVPRLLLVLGPSTCVSSVTPTAQPVTVPRTVNAPPVKMVISWRVMSALTTALTSNSRTCQSRPVHPVIQIASSARVMLRISAPSAMKLKMSMGMSFRRSICRVVGVRINVMLVSIQTLNKCANRVIRHALLAHLQETQLVGLATRGTSLNGWVSLASTVVMMASMVTQLLTCVSYVTTLVRPAEVLVLISVQSAQMVTSEENRFACPSARRVSSLWTVPVSPVIKSV